MYYHIHSPSVYRDSCLSYFIVDIRPAESKVKVKVKSAYGPMWPTRPELIPVSVA